MIGLAASGNTPFVVAGLTHARDKGALTIGIINNPGGKVGKAAEIEILLDTGPEFLAGSTRMKAGTAQKVALNTISTGVMIRLGFVYRGLMVEMLPTNAKLRERAVRMVADLTGARARDRTHHPRSRWRCIKLATVMLLQIAGSRCGAGGPRARRRQPPQGADVTILSVTAKPSADRTRDHRAPGSRASTTRTSARPSASRSR